MIPDSPYWHKYGMNKAQLLDILEDVPDDTLIVLAKDGEGNDYSPLADRSEIGKYEPESTWAGQYYGAEDIAEGYGEDGAPAVVLWPIN